MQNGSELAHRLNGWAENMRKLSIALCIPVLAYLIWPYIALIKLYIGLESANKKIVQEEILWPPIREGIEKDLNRFVKEFFKCQGLVLLEETCCRRRRINCLLWAAREVSMQYLFPLHV